MEKPWKEWLADYFSFSRKEMIAILLLLAAILLVWWLPVELPAPAELRAVPDSALQAVLAPTTQGKEGAGAPAWKMPRDSLVAAAPVKVRLFPFDPNSIGRQQWEELGVSPRTAGSILKYREKGGRFRRPEDLRRIYGLSPEQADRLIPYVVLPPPGGRYPVRDSFGKARPGPYAAINVRSARKENSPVFINRADSLDWLALPGIGPTLAGRIMRFRDKLGGFYSLRQVAEVYGLTDSVYRVIEPSLRLDTVPLRQLSINTAGREELLAHPYLRGKLAGAILAYRQAHGPFRQPEDLRRIHLLEEADFQRILPYCKIP